MTEEELAEEYAIRIINHKMALHDIFEKVKVECELKQAFLAGLNAKTQWHDLRKSPDDLPKAGVCVLVELENGASDISGVSTDKRWFCTDYYTGEDKVIAWCELPKFEE